MVKLYLVKLLGVLGMEIEESYEDSCAEEVKGRLEWIPSSSDSLLPEAGSVVPVSPVLHFLVEALAGKEEEGQEDDHEPGVVVALPVLGPLSCMLQFTQQCWATEEFRERTLCE